jgi:hypothetical protein
MFVLQFQLEGRITWLFVLWLVQDEELIRRLQVPVCVCAVLASTRGAQQLLGVTIKQSILNTNARSASVKMKSEDGSFRHDEVVRASLSQSPGVAQPVALGPIDFAIFALKGLSSARAWSIAPKLARHLVVEILAVDRRLLEDPVAHLAVWVREKRVCALRATLEAVIDEAGVAAARSVRPDLLALAVVVAGLRAASVSTRASERALTSGCV